ncbi:MAG: tyrosine-type recombinase/integrase [Candidatus Dormibacteria bacterium]|nr:tyrosine-type recombinase/integrase [Actinomycetota bacterium]
MNELRHHSEDYLNLRRALGYKLVGEGQLLAGFVTFCEQAGAAAVTTDLATAWTTSVAGSAPYLARRMRVTRCFARYLHSLDQSAEVPPAGLFPAGKHRPVPYIYSDDDVLALMAAARTLKPLLRAVTLETLIGLLAATGMRVSEAMALERDDVDWSNRLLTVRNSKYNKSREILVHLSTLDVLRAYSDERDRLASSHCAPSLFVSSRTTQLSHATVQPTFRELIRRAGLEQPPLSPQPKLHGLRHTFAVNTLLDWYRDGDDVAVRMPLLSTYLGHVDPAATYWYLSAVPELLALAAQRLAGADRAPR